MVKFLVGFMVGCLVGCSSARADDAPPPCAPCKIIGTISNPKGEVVEQFKYPRTFATHEACEQERDQDFFKLAMKDLQEKATNLGQLGPEFQNLTATAACAPLDEKPIHP